MLLSLTAQTIYANETPSQYDQIMEIDGKIYASPGSIHVGRNEIYLIIDGTFFPVQSVAVDEMGVFVTMGTTYIVCAKCNKRYVRGKSHTCLK